VVDCEQQATTASIRVQGLGQRVADSAEHLIIEDNTYCKMKQKKKRKKLIY
jgi:hypothetical protein